MAWCTVGACFDKENITEDCNVLVDQVLKKYKSCERAAPCSELTISDVPRRSEAEHTPQECGDGTSQPHDSKCPSAEDKENIEVDRASLGQPDLGRRSRRTASRRGKDPVDGIAGPPDPGRLGRRTASLRKSVLASTSSAERSCNSSEAGSSSSRGRLQSPELTASPGKHSTPYPPKKNTLHDSLFGFENLESPLVLSPLIFSPVKPASDYNVSEHTSKKSTEQQSRQWRSSGTVATVHAGPKQRSRPRNKVPEQSEQEDWMRKMNDEFKQVEEYDLVIQ